MICGLQGARPKAKKLRKKAKKLIQVSILMFNIVDLLFVKYKTIFRLMGLLTPVMKKMAWMTTMTGTTTMMTMMMTLILMERKMMRG